MTPHTLKYNKNSPHTKSNSHEQKYLFNAAPRLQAFPNSWKLTTVIIDTQT